MGDLELLGARTATRARRQKAASARRPAARRPSPAVRARLELLADLGMPALAVDANGAVVHCGADAARLLGRRAEELVDRPAAALLALLADRGAARRALATLRRRCSWQGVLALAAADGAARAVRVHASAVTEHGSLIGYVAVIVDVAPEPTVGESATFWQTTLDEVDAPITVTDLDRRILMWNSAAELLYGHTRAEAVGARIDELLAAASADGAPLDLARVLGPGRWDGEVSVRHRDGSELALYVRQRVIRDAEGTPQAVVGVAFDISERKAEEERLQRELERLSWVTRIQDALAEERLVLYAQPIIDVHSGELTQRELLLRMLPAGGGDPIAPGAFLAAAEEHGLIGEIDRWVVGRAAQLAAAGWSVELNVSGPSVSDPDLVPHITTAIAEAGADPKMMIFEITETTLVSDERAARAFVEQMHRLGCRVALDDFGTGYGTFTYLKQLPIDYLKIDVEFVRDLGHDPASRNVVTAIVSLARSFGLLTVGEGVEDERTLALLRELGVDYAQGFHIGRPAPFAPGAGTAIR